MANSDRIIGWQKLDPVCDKCGKLNSQVQFTFRCTEPLPGTRVESYHWECCPQNLLVYRADSEQAMIEEAMQPFRG